MSALLNRLFNSPLQFRDKFILACSPSPPPAPDYAGAARAQGAANVEAARTQGQINNPNVVTPYGTQTTTWGSGFDEQGYNAALDAYHNSRDQHLRQYGSYGPYVAPDRNLFIRGNPDQPTLTQTLSPEQQAIYDQRTQNQTGLGQVAGQGIDSLQGVVGTQVDFSGAPQTGSYDDTRRNVIDAMMSRTNEDYGRQTDQTNSDLVAAGIRPGTKAYADRMQMIERSRNDARQQAEIAGGNAASQAYGMDSDRRRQAITELLARRQTPLNEISALMSGSQVSNPFTAPGYAQNAQVAPAPVFGATQAQGAWDQGLYNVGAAQASNLQQGLFGLAGAGVMAGGMAMGGAPKPSDRRLKSNIVRLRTHPLGIGWYEYDIRGTREQGVMADEVEQVRPAAVTTMADGYKAVYYDRLT